MVNPTINLVHSLEDLQKLNYGDFVVVSPGNPMMVFVDPLSKYRSLIGRREPQKDIIEYRDLDRRAIEYDESGVIGMVFGSRGEDIEFILYSPDSAGFSPRRDALANFREEYTRW